MIIIKTYKLSEVTKDLCAVAMGNMPADTVITNVKLVNTNTREIIENIDIAIKKGRIALVGDASHTIGDSTNIIEGSGYYASPGFIDGHIHVESSMMTLPEYAKKVMPLGTTSIFHDPHEIGNVLGTAGIDIMLEDGDSVPLRCFSTMPSCVPAVSDFEYPAQTITPDEIKEYLKKDYICGLGEMMNMPGVLNGDDEIHQELKDTLESGKIITGHYTMPSLQKELNAYLDGGARCCHETVTKEAALQKMRLGMYVQMREGSAWQDVRELVPAILESKIDSRYATIVSDDTHPNTLEDFGHMDHIIRLAIKCGVDPIESIQMATINTAFCFQVEKDLGSIAPSKLADIVLFKDLENIKADIVLINGEVVSKEGKLTIDIPKKEYPEFATNTVKLKKPLKKEDFTIKAPNNSKSFKTHVVKIIEVKAPNIHVVMDMENTNGEILQDLKQDILKVATIERHHESGLIGLGFVHGFGLKNGAIASTVSHDAHNITIIGTNDKDMAFAANELAKMGGGIVAVKDEKVIASMPLKLAGLMSILPSDIIVSQINQIEEAWTQLGCTIKSPFMTLALISLAVIPELRITNKGLVDTLDYKIINLFDIE